MPSVCFTNTPEPAAPLPPTAILDPSRTRVLQCSSPWAIKNAVFSEVLGVVALMARLVTRSGHLGYQK